MTRSDGRPPARVTRFSWARAGTARIAVDLLGGDDAPDVVVDGALPGPHAEPQQNGHLASRRRAAGEAFATSTLGVAR